MTGGEAMTTAVGIDIAAKQVEMTYRQQGRCAPVSTFSQSPEGHAALINRLKALKPQIVVMEATGIYYLDLAVALAKANLPVSVINPRSFRHFAELKLQGSKTDGIDSALLAEYGERMMPRRWTPPDNTRLALRDLARKINRLTHARTQAKNRLHALQAKKATFSLLVEDEQAGIEQLNQRIERLQQAVQTLIAKDAVLCGHLEHIQAGKGFGMASAIAILGELCLLPEHLKGKQVSRYAGLDVRLRQSGTSVNSPGRLSKAGNAYLRSALFMPALSAVRYDPPTRAFYNCLVARGKKKIQALCAVMRKYLTGIWACLKYNQPFDTSRLFSEKHLKMG
jgi:transposase